MKLDCLIIIRASSERTTSISKILIEKQGINENQIISISEVPFSKAVVRTFKEGINGNYKWTLGLDADILYRKDHLIRQVRFADTLPDNYFMVQGMVLDKIQMIKRSGGGHLYRTSLIPKALENFEHISDLDRPEATLNHKMKSLGFPYYNWDKLLSLHDYEQYHVDLFRKGYAQAIKHYSTSIKLSKLWAQLMAKDDDYLMIYLGFIAGANYKKKMGIEELNALASSTLQSLGIKEKEALTSTLDIEKIIDGFLLNPQLYKYQQNIISATDTLNSRRKNLPNFQISRVLRQLGIRPEKFAGIFN